MKRFYQQGYTKFSFKRIITETNKAILFEITPGINIWLPMSWINKLNRVTFVVKDHFATEVKLKITAEHNKKIKYGRV
jgi:hypothetical protein